MLAIQISILVVLLILFAQDLTGRLVYWVLFPILTALFITIRFMRHQPLWEMLQPIGINVVFITLQLLLVSLYFCIKEKRWVNITDSLFNWGDILFLFTVAFYLSVLNFLAFYIGSLLVVITMWQTLQAITKKERKQIPLAGLQALIFSVILATAWWIKPIDLTGDDWLLNLIAK